MPAPSGSGMTVATPRGRPRGWLAFALAAVALVLAVDFYSYQAATKANSDCDVWWVAAAGRDLLDSAQLPRENGYAVKDSGASWVMHEWLFAPLFGWGLQRFGPAFFSLVTLVAFNALAAALLWIAIGAGGALWLSATTCLASLFLFWAPASARPTRVAVFFPVAMAGLAFSRRFTPWHALGALGLELLWANAHGSFPLGVALLLAGALAERSERRARLGTAAAAALITLVNPYGLGLHRLVWRYLRADEPIFVWIHQSIDEYKPLWRSILLQSRVSVGLGLLLALALWALTNRELRTRALLTLGLLGLAVLQVRDAQWVGPLGVVLLAPGLPLLVPETLPVRLGRSIVALAIGSGLALGAIANVVARRARPPAYWYGWQAPMAELAQQLPDGARVAVPFQGAGLVLWLTAPRGVRVLFDSRNDCYSAETAADYYDLFERNPLPPGTLETLDRDWITHVIAPTGGRLAEVLEGAKPNWQRTHTAGPISTYERTLSMHDP